MHCGVPSLCLQICNYAEVWQAELSRARLRSWTFVDLCVDLRCRIMLSVLLTSGHCRSQIFHRTSNNRKKLHPLNRNTHWALNPFRWYVSSGLCGECGLDTVVQECGSCCLMRVTTEGSSDGSGKKSCKKYEGRSKLDKATSQIFRLISWAIECAIFLVASCEFATT